MNRRNFLTTMAALPFVGLVAKAACILPSQPVKSIVPVIPPAGYDYYPIMFPHEMPSYGFIHFPIPCGLIDGTAYTVRTYKLKLYSDGIPDINNMEFREKCQIEAAYEIHRLQLTHLYILGFTAHPIITHDNKEIYSAYVRGIKYQNIIHRIG